MIYENDDKPFKTTCQRCDIFVRCLGSSVELLCISFICYGIYTLVIYPKEIHPETFYFQWPGRTKIQHISQRILKEVNGAHKQSMCKDICNNNFKVLFSSTTLNRADLGCTETIKYKLTRNNSSFIPCLNTI